jgi:hypothetical protein
MNYLVPGRRKVKKDLRIKRDTLCYSVVKYSSFASLARGFWERGSRRDAGNAKGRGGFLGLCSLFDICYLFVV